MAFRTTPLSSERHQGHDALIRNQLHRLSLDISYLISSFVKRKEISSVLMELISDERMVGRQHFGFKLRKDAKGNRVLGSDANGSVSFELAQIAVGPDRVPISIVLYIGGTYIKHGIPILPIYSELLIYML
jgi:hypothetical protein